MSEEKNRLARKMEKLPKNMLRSHIDFELNATIEALGPIAAVFPFIGQNFKEQAGELLTPGLNEDGFLGILYIDLARAFKDLTTVMADLRRLANISDLPVLPGKGSVV
jgi:hypothetical protein